MLTQLSLPWQAETFESKVDSVLLSVANELSTEIAASARVTPLLPEVAATTVMSTT